MEYFQEWNSMKTKIHCPITKPGKALFMAKQIPQCIKIFLNKAWHYILIKTYPHSNQNFFTFGPRGRRARSARRPRGQNVAAIALDMGQAHLWYENNTMQTIHAIQTLRTVCGFLDMGDGCCLIFNKNQLMFIVRKSITAQIKKKNLLFFS